MLRADVLEPRRAADVLQNELRDADPARTGETLEPGGDVDAGAVDPIVVDNDLTAVDAHPKLHPVSGRVALVRLQHEPLELSDASSAEAELPYSNSMLSPGESTSRPP